MSLPVRLLRSLLVTLNGWDGSADGAWAMLAEAIKEQDTIVTALAGEVAALRSGLTTV